MAELADATDLKSVEGKPHGGSSPPGAIINTRSMKRVSSSKNFASKIGFFESKPSYYTRSKKTQEALEKSKQFYVQEEVNKQLGFWAIPLPNGGDTDSEEDDKPRYIKK